MKYKELKQRVKNFCAMKLPGEPQMMHIGTVDMGTVDLVNDLWRAVETSVQALRKISVPANEVGSCCFRCGAKWGEGHRERHLSGCVLEGTEP